MGPKSEQKKQLIITAARGVFASKGFTAVTMKDIADACQISRGGLYLYYPDTAAVFLDVLKADSAEADDAYSKAVRDNHSAAGILALFLQEQKKELLDIRGTLLQATFEYAFTKDDAAILRTNFYEAAKIIEHLIRIGQGNGELECEDPKLMSVHIMFLIEGMKVSARTVRITEEEIDREIALIMENLHVQRK